MFKNIGIKTKLLLTVCLVVLVSYTITITYITLDASAMAKQNAEKTAEEIANNYSHQIEAELTSVMGIARNLAHVFEGMKISNNPPPREAMNEILKHILKQNPGIIAVDTCWEPNAIDGKDSEFKNTEGHDENGRFVPYWNRGSGSIAVEPLLNIDNEPWYALPRDTGKEVLTNPYVYPVGGKDVLMTTVVVPIKVQGKFLGMTAIDITLDALSEMTKDIKPFGTGYGFIIANNGFVVTHPKKDLIGKNLSEILEPEFVDDVMRSAKEGKMHSGIRDSLLTGKTSLQLIVPIHVGKTDTPWSMGVSVPMETIMENAKSLRNTSIIIVLITLATLFAAIFYVSQALVISPLTRVIHGLRDIAEGEGDLTLRLPVNSKDEIGVLSGWFNTFLEKLQNIIKELAEKSSEMDTSSAGLLTIAGELSDNAGNTSLKSKAVSAAVQQMSESSLSAAATMKETSENINMVAASADEMASTIQEIAKNSENASSITLGAVTQARKTAEQMEALSTAATDIGNVTEAINEISEQTNLLALNATIEAARAGEAGKGFAVVAGEIKDLASQTAKATADIKNRISAIQEVAEKSVKGIGDIASVVREVNDIVSSIATAVTEQSTVTNDIAGNIAQASQGVQDVNNGLDRSSTASAEISEDTSEVNKTADKMSESAVQVHENARELASLSTRLREIVDTFKI